MDFQWPSEAEAVETTLPCWKPPKKGGSPQDRLERWAGCVIPPETKYLGSGDWMVVAGSGKVEVEKVDWRRVAVIERSVTRFTLRPEAAARRRAESAAGSDPSTVPPPPPPHHPTGNTTEEDEMTDKSQVSDKICYYYSSPLKQHPEESYPDREGKDNPQCSGCCRQLYGKRPPWEDVPVQYRRGPAKKVLKNRKECGTCRLRFLAAYPPFLDAER